MTWKWNVCDPQFSTTSSYHQHGEASEKNRSDSEIVFILIIFVYHISSSRNIQVMLKDIFQDSSKLRRKLLKTCLEGIWKWVKSTKHLASKTQKKSLGIWFFFKISKFIIFFNKKKYKVSLYFYLRGSTFYIGVICFFNFMLNVICF